MDDPVCAEQFVDGHKANIAEIQGMSATPSGQMVAKAKGERNIQCS